MVAGIPRNNVSNDKSEWRTPTWLFKKLDDEFHFDLDAAATNENALAPLYFTKEDDALKQDWYVKGQVEKIFLNPPYGRDVVRSFVREAFWESRSGATVVCLIPFVGSGWFKTYCFRAKEIRIIGRVKYIGYDLEGNKIENSPTFDSCVAVFTPGFHYTRLEVFE